MYCRDNSSHYNLCLPGLKTLRWLQQQLAEEHSGWNLSAELLLQKAPTLRCGNGLKTSPDVILLNVARWARDLLDADLSRTQFMPRSYTPKMGNRVQAPAESLSGDKESGLATKNNSWEKKRTNKKGRPALKKKVGIWNC